VTGTGVRRGPWTVCLAITLAALGLLGAPSASAAYHSEFYGIVQGPTLDAKDFQGLAKAGVRTDRFMFNWGWVQPKSGASFNWTGPDRLIGALASHGVRAVPAFWGNPEWVLGSSARPPLTRARDVEAWRNLLQAATVRYGPGGTYWATRYHRQYGAGAKPLPITSWQIWNEPNLKKFFAPRPSPREYAQLVRISHDAIRSRDPTARIVLAGMPGYGDMTAWRFLSSLYSVPRIASDFDAAALHPYARNLAGYEHEIRRFRAVMDNHGDAATPLWISELAWGSAPPDHFGINQGPAGQARMLRGSYKMVLSHRAAWNVQRLFWFHWRDPRDVQPGTCSFCGSAGLLNHNRTPKPAYWAFRSFSADKTPPKVSITAGPAQGTAVGDRTPTFRFASSEPGSTFRCRFGVQPYSQCTSPATPKSPLADGAHSFSVRAIDAAGNPSRLITRSFTVDTVAPKATISSGPSNGSQSGNTNPSFSFSASEGDVAFRCRVDGAAPVPCSSPRATGRLGGGAHTFAVAATDRAGNVGPPAHRAWTIVTGAPTVRLVSGPRGGSTSSDPRPSFAFDSSEQGSRFQCRLDSGPFLGCASPHAIGPLADGRHVFRVRAIDPKGSLSSPLQASFRVDTSPPKLRIQGPGLVRTQKRLASAAFTLRAPERAGLRCRLGSTGFAPCSRHYRSEKLGGGPHTLVVEAVDPAGNVARRGKRFRIVERGRAQARAAAARRARVLLGRLWNGPAAAGG
jgi:Glycosyl hydrolase catalytic core